MNQNPVKLLWGSLGLSASTIHSDCPWAVLFRTQPILFTGEQAPCAEWLGPSAAHALHWLVWRVSLCGAEEVEEGSRGAVSSVGIKVCLPSHRAGHLLPSQALPWAH